MSQDCYELLVMSLSQILEQASPGPYYLLSVDSGKCTENNLPSSSSHVQSHTPTEYFYQNFYSFLARFLQTYMLISSERQEDTEEPNPATTKKVRLDQEYFHNNLK